MVLIRLDYQIVPVGHVKYILDLLLMVSNANGLCVIDKMVREFLKKVIVSNALRDKMYQSKELHVSFHVAIEKLLTSIEVLVRNAPYT